MLEGDNRAAVRASCLLWLKGTIAPKVSVAWAQKERAVSQVRDKKQFSVAAISITTRAVALLRPTRFVKKKTCLWRSLPAPEFQVTVAGLLLGVFLLATLP